jgi:hypothetical protein
MNENAILAKHARRIKSLERNTLSAALEIGGLLKQVADISDHGVYQDWIYREFKWSYRTSLRYRSVFELAQKCQSVTFDDFDITLTALYFLADLDDLDTIKSVLEIARTQRVTVGVARELVENARPGEDETQDTDADSDDDTAPPGDDTVPPDDDDDGTSDDEADPAPNELAASLTVLLADHHTGEWRSAIEQIGGGTELRLVITILDQVHREHCESDSMRARADAAEARSKMQLTAFRPAL